MNVQRVAPLSGDSGIYVVVDIDDIWNIRVVVLSQLSHSPSVRARLLTWFFSEGDKYL